jgi:amino acid transporter
MEADLRTKELSSRRQWLTSGSIIGSGLFIGSAIFIQYNLFIGIVGLVASAGTFVVTLAFARRKR